MVNYIESTVTGFFTVENIIFLTGKLYMNNKQGVYFLPEKIYNAIIKHISNMNEYDISSNINAWYVPITTVPVIVTEDKIENIKARLKLII